MSSESNFAASLEMGIAAENIVYDYLVQNNSFVEDLRQQKHGEFAGPRLVGTEGTLVLPDFLVYNKNPNKGNFAVDVKAKSSSSLYTIRNLGNKKCFTVDDKYEQYKRVTEIKRLDRLVIVFFFEGRMYFYGDSNCLGPTTFKNTTYGTGPVYCFEYDEDKIQY